MTDPHDTFDAAVEPLNARVRERAGAIPAGWTITRGTDDQGDEYVAVRSPEDDSTRRYYADELPATRRMYLLACALLDAPPAPQAEPKRVPLTDEQRGMVILTFQNIADAESNGQPWITLAAAKTLARNALAALRAHGITLADTED